MYDKQVTACQLFCAFFIESGEKVHLKSHKKSLDEGIQRCKLQNSSVVVIRELWLFEILEIPREKKNTNLGFCDFFGILSNWVGFELKDSTNWNQG
jgi:hypothetical protein